MTNKILDYTPDIELPDGILELYNEAFPPAERRQWTAGHDLRLFMGNHPKMKLRVIKSSSNSKIDGFVVYWQLSPALRYIEHLATRPELRGQGLGAALMRTLLNDTNQHLILEVEPPVYSLTKRRVEFYNRLGLVLHDKLRYKQPPYASSLPEVELCIMSTPGVNDELLKYDILPLLKRIVYQQ